MWHVHQTWRCKYRRLAAPATPALIPCPLTPAEEKVSHVHTPADMHTYEHSGQRLPEAQESNFQFTVGWEISLPQASTASSPTWILRDMGLTAGGCLVRACVCARAWERMSEEIKWQRVKQTDWGTSLREKCGQRERLSRSEKWQIKDLAYLIQHFPVQLQ